MPNDNTHTGRWMTVDELANFIRVVDGNHDKGAGAIAEELLPMIEARLPHTPVPTNDNTHTGIDWLTDEALHAIRCDSPGNDEVSDWNDWFVRICERAVQIFLSHTPAEPKAGDWEKELDQLHDALGLLKLGDHPDKVFGEYVFPLFRALSSAAPRITEAGAGEDWWSETVDTYFTEHADGKRKMPPGAYLRRHWEEDTGYWCNELVHIRQGEDWTTADIDTMWIGPFPEWVFNSPAPLSGITEEMVERWIEDARGLPDGKDVTELFEHNLALLRQQGAEREWISVDERLPEKNTPIFIRWGDEKASPDTSNLKDSRVASTRIRHLMRIGKIGWWCERRVFVDQPPPFTPAQTEEPDAEQTISAPTSRH